MFDSKQHSWQAFVVMLTRPKNIDKQIGEDYIEFVFWQDSTTYKLDIGSQGRAQSLFSRSCAPVEDGQYDT